MLNKRTGPTKREGWTIFENLINGQGRYVPEKLKYSYTTSSFLSKSDAKSNFLHISICVLVQMGWPVLLGA